MATEFMTTSSVMVPTIVQTLPVHITLTVTSTKGIDGYFTLADIVHGPSSVVNQPIATATLDLDAAGVFPSNLDMSNIDLSQYDLSSLSPAFGSTDQAQMVSALTALLQQYGNEPPKQVSSRISSGTRFKTGNRNGRQQQQQSFGRNTAYEDDIFVDHEEPPKFNVIKGFTLSDRAPPSPRSSRRPGGGGGSAATATRYSKYHKKPDPENNGISLKNNESERESERYSASTSRRTFSKTNGRQLSEARNNRRSPSSRFEPAEETQYYEETPSNRFNNNGRRNNRNIEFRSNRRKGGLSDNLTPSSAGAQKNKKDTKSMPKRISTLKRFTSRGRPNTSLEKVVAVQPNKTLQTTVLTMFVSGTSPGDFKKIYKTVTLRSLQTNLRSKRNAILSTKLPDASPTNSNTIPDVETRPKLKPEDVIQLLKKLDKNAVKSMLKSLAKWVQYYKNEFLEAEEGGQNRIIDKSRGGKEVEEAPPLLASSLSLVVETAPSATTALPSGQAVTNGAASYCLPPVTVTETVYHTVVLQT